MDEHEAWAGYYRDYAPGLYRYVLGRVGNPHDAEDIVADAFMRVASHLDRLEGNPAYLYTTARNLIADRFTRARAETPSSATLEPAPLQIYPPLEDDPERAALLAQDQAEVRWALGQLTADERDALELRYFGELSSAAIGAVIGKTPGSVDTLTSRARLRMGQRLRLAQVDAARIPDWCWNNSIPRLSTHIDGKLKSPEREQTLAHLGGCEPCQEAYGAMQEAGRRIRVLIPPVLVLPSLTERIGAELAASAAASAAAEAHRSAASTAWYRRLVTQALLGTAAAAVSVILVFAVPPLLARPVLDLTPKSLNFGQQTPLGQSSEQTITVTNRGTQPVQITELRIEGPNAGEFVVTRTTCTEKPVPVGGTCSATIRFTRTTEGASSVALSISGRSKPWWLP